ncbi:MAG: ATP-binding protein, partial [Acidimicrobiia bacterium]
PEEGHDEFTDLARSFNRMADALERTLANQRRFVSDVSHELRTPLTALTTAADVLEANAGGLNDQGRRAARLLVVESRRLGRMVEDLMEISRFDAGVPSMVWEPVDLAHQVTGAVASRGWADRVGTVLAPDAMTWGDPRRLDRVVANLIGNALEHGAPPVTVTVAVHGDAISLAVDDSGPGIPPDQLEHLFERFYKGDPSRSRGGSGLGLAIARENARLHGGDIIVQTIGGRGSRFTFTLPRRDGPPDDPQPIAQYERARPI